MTDVAESLVYGGIYLANLNPGRKQAPTEISKTRPVLVMQSQALLESSHPSTLIFPLTTQLRDSNFLRFRVSAREDLKKDSDVVLDQMRAIDNQRFQSIQPLCILDLSTMNQIYQRFLDILKP